MSDQVAQNGKDDSKKPLDKKDEKLIEKKPSLTKEEITYGNKIVEREKKTESKGERDNLKKDIKKPNQHNNRRRRRPPRSDLPKQEGKNQEQKKVVPINPFTKPEWKPKPEPKPEAKPEPKPEAKPEVKPEIKHEVKPEVKASVNPFAKKEVAPQVSEQPSVPAPVNPFAKPESIFHGQSQSTLNPSQSPAQNVPSKPSTQPVNPFAKAETKPEVKSEMKAPMSPFAKAETEKPEVLSVGQEKNIKLVPVPHAVSPEVPSAVPPVKQEKKKEEFMPQQSPFAKENGEAKAINPFEKQDTTKKAFVDAKTVVEEKHKPNPFEQDKKEAVKVEVIDGGAKKHSMPVTPTVSAGKTEKQEQTSPEPNDFRSEFWDILEQAGITKGKLITVVVVIVVGILAFLGFVFDWYKIFDFSSSPSSNEENKQQVVAEKQPIEEDKIPVANSKAYGLISSYIFGVEYGKLLPDEALLPIGAYGREDSILAGLELGGARDVQKIKFAYYASLLRKMQNVYEVDIYTLLNQSTDRSATLNQYLLDFNAVISEAMIAYSEIDQQANVWFAEYDQIIKNQNSIETQFFNNLNGLTGESAYQALGDFIKSSQQAVEIKGYANAYKALRLMFINSLNVIRPRYSDVYYNREALIKGVKVIDVPGSDINAIIRTSQ